jgi:pyrimidine-nucleoside phosphorylase
MDEPLGRAVGNALEVEEAVRTLRGEGPEDLRELCLVLGAQMLVLAGLARDAAAGRAALEARLARGDGARRLAEMIAAQGGDPGVVERPERLPRAPLAHPVPAAQDGTVAAVDAEALGGAAILLGAGRMRGDERIDPGAGMVIHRKVGDRVRRGDALATLHTADAARLREAEARVRAAYRIGDAAAEPRPLVLEIVG